MTTPQMMTAAQARAVDPITTQVARGYGRTEEHVWPYLFPVVNVGARGGVVIEFGAEHKRERDSRRSPGATVGRVEFGYGKARYTLWDRDLDGQSPIEVTEEAQSVGIDMERVAVEGVMDALSLEVEIEAEEIATKAANYPAGHTAAVAAADKWSKDTSKPNQQVAAKFKTIRQGIGRNPNTLVLGSEVGDRMRVHPDVLAAVKRIMGDNAPVRDITDAMLAAYFGVERVVSAESTKGEPGAFQDIWGDVAILAYTRIADLASHGRPSFGYTYRLRDYPTVMTAYYDAGTRSMMYPAKNVDTPVLAGAAGGYLFTGVLA